MYSKFQQWTAQSWEDLQTDRRDWQFMQDTGTVVLNPKMEVYGCSSTNSNVSDYASATFRLHNTDNANVLVAASLGSATDGTFVAGDYEASLTIASFSTTAFMVEPGDLLTTATGSALAYFKRWGRYDLNQAGTYGRDETDDIAEIKVDSVAIADVQFASGQSYDLSTYAKLEFVPYNKWLLYGYDRPKHVGKPTKFTVSNDGKLEFYPPLDTAYHLYFEYTKTPQTLTAYTDEPTGLPSRFHKAISWKALMYYGEYDGISRIYNIAKNRYSKFEYEMIRDLLPEVNIGYDARRF